MGALPGPSSRFYGIDLYPAFRRSLLEMLQQLAREYGDVAFFRIGPLKFVLLSHPDYVEDVLVTRAHLFHKGRALERARRLLGNGLLTSEGGFHLRQRRLVQPSFHKARIAGYARTMISRAERTSERWQDGESLDIVSEMNRLMLTIVGDTLFGTDVEGDADVVRLALVDMFEAFPITMSPLAPILERLPLPVVRRYLKAQHALDSLIYRMIAQRRAHPDDRGDLLSMLLLARDEDHDGSQMTDRQVRDEVMTIFLAGHETTANALAWTWLLLARHPDVESRLHRELDEVLGGRAPQPEDAARLPYTRRVLSESMRCYPPAWTLGRKAMEDFVIGGYTVPAGTLILMPQYLLHHDARFFPDPEVFDPDRWLPERQVGRPKYAYFPFGGGNRVCIGESFAWTEGILVLAALARRWRLELLDSAPVPMKPRMTLRPAQAIPMRMVERVQPRP
jgi:cytochrome P450